MHICYSSDILKLKLRLRLYLKNHFTLCFFFLETVLLCIPSRSRISVDQAGLLVQRDLLIAGIKGICHHSWPDFLCLRSQGGRNLKVQLNYFCSTDSWMSRYRLAGSDIIKITFSLKKAVQIYLLSFQYQIRWNHGVLKGGEKKLFSIMFSFKFLCVLQFDRILSLQFQTEQPLETEEFRTQLSLKHLWKNITYVNYICFLEPQMVWILKYLS